MALWQVFFFQAEDGIRDHAQSRGLGDVYKRQFFPSFQSLFSSIMFSSVFSLSYYDTSLVVFVFVFSILLLIGSLAGTFLLSPSVPRQAERQGAEGEEAMYSALIPVSYTHLTLPTICSVQISVGAVSLKKKESSRAGLTHSTIEQT
eukprot:TRINITY_DN21722_c0_g1_i1.p1 TRINITY_DN21722_c0_g1~~TRINITY_DN21722_c0_g1_i1.p1  ORF type:complete len:147 (-),score=12.19 TRINITY_DN21722_c0_g1_i1:25-465(-)